jgi:hypothetical protein
MNTKNKLIFALFFSVVILLSNCTSTSSDITINNVTTDPSGAGDQIFIGNSGIVFLSANEAAETLAEEDEYIKGLSRFDYASKMKLAKQADYNERLEFYNDACLDWEPGDIERVAAAIQSFNAKISKLNLNLPPVISLIKTNGNEEGGAAYTRGVSIAFPELYLKKLPQDKFIKIFVHEIFHVFSRFNKELREEIYAVIQYKKCNELQLPPELKDFEISNPDAPDNNYYISCTYKGAEYDFIPILYSNEPYDISRGLSFFRYLHDDMLAVEIIDDNPVPIYKNEQLLIVKKEELSAFYEKIGRNTDYTFHPEETMADNFVFLVFGDKVPSPEIVRNLKQAIMGR